MFFQSVPGHLEQSILMIRVIVNMLVSKTHSCSLTLSALNATSSSITSNWVSTPNPVSCIITFTVSSNASIILQEVDRVAIISILTY